MDILFKVLFILAVVVGLIAVTKDMLLPAARRVPVTATVFDALPVFRTVTVTGTLAYETNNANLEVPYLIYKNDSGGTEAKALVFGSTSVCATPVGDYPCALIESALRTYYGPALVQVSGVVEHEHINVDSLTPATN